MNLAGQSLLSGQHSFFRKYYPELILVVGWVVTQLFIFYNFGIVTEFEARRYINEADYFLHYGTVSTPNYWLYSTQIFLIVAAKQLHTGYVSVVIVQLLFNAFATYSLYKFCLRQSNRPAAFLCILLFIINLPFQSFNTFLFTESLFFSLTIIFSCYLLQLQKLGFKTYIRVSLFLLIICFTRPTGLLFIPCTFLYVFFRFFKSFPILLKIGITAVISILFLFLLNIALGSGGGLDFTFPFRNERIICGIAGLTGLRDIKTSDNPNSVLGLIYYVVHNPEQFLRMTWLRSIAFFGIFRPYYSWPHNLYLAFCFYPLYLGVIFSVKTWLKYNPLTLMYCIGIITVTWVGVIFTCDDWHNRFFLSIAPYFYILSLPTMKKLTARIKFDGKKQ